MRLALILILSGCAATEAYEVPQYPDCAQVTLRAGQTCEIRVFQRSEGL